MESLRLGDHVTFQGRTFVVRGFSPMSIAPPRVVLEHELTGEQVEVNAGEVEKRV